VGKTLRLHWRTVANRGTNPASARKEARPILRFSPLQGFASLAGVLAIAGGALGARSDAPWHEGFEGPNTSWRPAGADLEYRLEVHGRARGGAHTGQGSEQLRVSGTNGSYVDFSHPVPPSRITTELAASVWVKADRPGLQILARIVLPGLTDPRTRQPATVFIRGTSYTQVGIWEQLRLENIPIELERQMRVLRWQLRHDVDSRGAYLDQVWLNVYGGPGTTNVAIDDLEISGIVEPIEPARDAVFGAEAQARSGLGTEPTPSASNGNSEQAVPPQVAGPRITMTAQDAVREGPSTRAQGVVGPIWTGTAGGVRPAAHEVKLDGSVLLVDGHPFFPRILRYQGESIELIARAGFNAIRLSQPPPPQLLADAQRIGLWLVCPPPVVADGTQVSVGPLGPEYDSVLAWHLGDGLTMQDLPNVTEIVRQLQRVDARKRPTICAPEIDVRAFSRRVDHVDLLSFSRAPLGTSVELVDYIDWLRERPRLGRPGTMFWSTVQTQLSPAAAQQWAQFSGSRLPLAADTESIRLLTYAALSAGARGIEFRLELPLSAAPPGVQLELALLNMELALAEPWTATGSFVVKAASSDQQITGAVLQAQSTRLVLPMRIAHYSQYAPQPATGPGTIVVPGVPEGHEAYELTPAGLLPLKHQRVTGGMQIAIDDFQLTSMLLITSDPAAVSALSRRLAQMAERAAPVAHDLAVQSLAEVEAVDRRLPHKPQEPAAADWLGKARAGIAAADKALAAGDRPAAYQAARKAMGPLEQLKRHRWEQTVTGQNSLVTSPLTVSFQTLPEQGRLTEQLRYLQPSNNQLPGGDCENVAWMMQHGWQHVEHRQLDVRSSVELSTDQPHGGKSSLHLQVTAARPDQPPALVETAPVWVTTAPISVQANQLIAVRGFIRVPPRIGGSIDGLLILDSIGGESLAERVGETKGWREFIMYRMAPRDGMFTVTFALTGLGDAWIDDISIAPVTRLSGNEIGRMQPQPPINGGLAVRR
jgi:hypothetical protein